MSTTFRLVHLSDLHFSHGSLPNPKHSHSVEHLLGIQQVLNAEDVYDLVVVTGDISNRGDPESLNQAKQWIMHQFTTIDNRLTGLNCPPERLILVPGNHDAYNQKEPGQNLTLARQKSLANYNTIFPQHAMIPDDDCRYYWYAIEGNGIFIVAADSSFLGEDVGDQTSDLRTRFVNTLGRVARGKLSRHQSKQILRWFDLGMQGKLLHPSDGDVLIDKDQFRESLKLLVMHHYVFEPPGHSLNFTLDLIDRNQLLRNLAMADFDVILCGHRHVNAFLPTSYASFFTDRRAKARYLMNLFRRLIHVASLPDQLHDRKGRPIGKRISTFLSYFLLTNPKQPNETDDAYLERLIEAFRQLLAFPSKWQCILKDFTVPLEGPEQITISTDEAQEIAKHILSALTRSERDKLVKEVARIKTVFNAISKRPLLQGMCGSSAKGFTLASKDRSFSVLDINVERGNWTITQKEYVWHATGSKFEGPFKRSHAFENNRRLPF